jgi:SAM-dependent methyltransferase
MYKDGTYAVHNPTWHADDSPWKARQILELLRNEGVQPRTLAEVGCGVGGVIAGVAAGLPELERADGWDIAPQAIERALPLQTDRLHFTLGDLTESRQVYDLCLCIDVFEHVEDYLGFLRRLRPRATAHVFHIPLDMHLLSVVLGGMLPAYRKVSGHLHYFSRGTALATLEHAGYEVANWRYTAGAVEASASRGSPVRAPLNVARSGLQAMSTEWSQRLLGGCSLLVIAR